MNKGKLNVIRIRVYRINHLMMKTQQFFLYLALLPGLFYSISVNAQISQGGLPVSFEEQVLTSDIPTAMMPAIELAALQAEDNIRDHSPGQPWRFGKNFAVNLGLDNSGVWETLANGDKVWRLKIYAPGALTINLSFNDYHLPKGAQLFIYNESKSEILGAFTHKNNQPSRVFATDLVTGDIVILEYYEPQGVSFSGSLNADRVTHGYRSLIDKARGFGDSGFCNINVNCPEGDDWQDHKRAVALIIVNGNEWCTGSLLNNVLEDGTPYFLTADHCLTGGVATWVFRFNYESENCQSQDGPKTQAVTGAVVRASSSNSDFALLELTSKPPDSYGAYYLGWDNSGNQPTSQVCIHHPSGDIKKISFDNDPAISTTWQSAEVWEVSNWEDGTTEGGSSGSPLFDQNQRVIGQLYGGPASCTDISDDNYGRIDASWDGFSAGTRLKDWLDPGNSGDSVVNGFDPNIPKFTLDAITDPLPENDSVICDSAIALTINITNNGEQTLSSLNINYDLNGTGVQVYEWAGSLVFKSSEAVTLPVLALTPGLHEITVFTSDPNAGLDEDPSTDSLTFRFRSFDDHETMGLSFKTDNRGSETRWEIKDSAGQVIYGAGPYKNISGGQVTNYNLCLGIGCYTLIVSDSEGNGMCCEDGSGGYTVYDQHGRLIKASNGDFSDLEIFNFCVTHKDPTDGIDPLHNDPEIIITPNPASDKIFVQLSEPSTDTKAAIYDVSGKIILQRSLSRGPGEIDLSSLDAGLYLVVIQTNNRQISHKVIVNR